MRIISQAGLGMDYDIPYEEAVLKRYEEVILCASKHLDRKVTVATYSTEARIIDDGRKRYGKSKEPKTRFRNGSILQYSLDGEFINSYYCATEASRVTGVCARNILQVANKEPFNSSGSIRKQAGGYIWKFEKEVV